MSSPDTEGGADDDRETISLSALQHYLYCPRQCALIHVEQQWVENRYTAEGRILHQRVDRPVKRMREGVRTVTGMPLSSKRLGLRGVADVIEFEVVDGAERAFPIEYKRGRPKAHRADEVQLCAQALCLEEMQGLRIAVGALFYGKTRRRKDVEFTADLRELTEEAASNARAMILSGRTPLPIYSARLCKACSLIEICRPQRLSRRSDVAQWLCRQIED